MSSQLALFEQDDVDDGAVGDPFLYAPAPTSRRIEYESASNDHGQCSFTLLWLDSSGSQRAQCFRADPREFGFPRPEDALSAREGQENHR